MIIKTQDQHNTWIAINAVKHRIRLTDLIGFDQYIKEDRENINPMYEQLIAEQLVY